jgi:hypothetical protein
VTIVDVIEFPGITKAQAFKRAKEWGALNFGDLESVLEYEDFETGKIILEGFTEITQLTRYKGVWGGSRMAPTSSKLYFSLVITIKDGKAKVQYENLEYRYWHSGYASATFYVPGEWFINSINSYFPVTSLAPDMWEPTIEMLQNSVRQLKSTAPSLSKHILESVDDYRF